MWIDQHEYEKVGQILRTVREAAGLTQMALAARLSKPQSFVSSCETGQRRVDLLELKRICTALSADPMSVYSLVLAREKSKQMKR
jgi:transcriptional regulator with XRE-family HTH domain